MLSVNNNSSFVPWCLHPNDNRVQVFEMFGADIGLTTNHVLKIMAEADDNDDGVIEYKECEFKSFLAHVGRPSCNLHAALLGQSSH